MANNIKGLPWVLDTAGASAVKTGYTWVRGIIFSGYTLASHKAVIKDAHRNVIIATLDGDAELTAQSIIFSEPMRVRDLALTTLDSGQVTVDVA